MEIWSAFCRLTMRRPVSGMGIVGAIPYTEMITFVDGVYEPELDDEEDRQLFLELIEFLDVEYLKLHNEKMEKERKQQEAKNQQKKSQRKPPR